MSDMKCSVIVISLEGRLVPDLVDRLIFVPPGVEFEPEDAPLLGVLVC